MRKSEILKVFRFFYLRFININYKLVIKFKNLAMTTFTSTLPDDLMELLSQKSKALKLPKNKLIEKALRIYLDQLTKAEYIKSYKNAANDENILSIAEEGMADYFKQLEE